MTATLFQSRAQAIGIKPKVLAGRTRRSLASAKAILEKLALPWADIDNTVEFNLASVLDEFDKFEASLDDSIKWLLDPEGS